MVGVALAHTGTGGAGSFWTPGEPIVPCGGTLGVCQNGVCSNGFRSCQTNDQCGKQPACDKCQLWHLVRHVIDLILVGLAPILAVLFFILAGVYMILGGANPGMYNKGKSILKDTIIGLLIIMLAWLITNTLIRSLIDPNNIPVCRGNICSNGVGACTTNAQCGWNWYQVSCS